jgi:hypothetical protein
MECGTCSIQEVWDECNYMPFVCNKPVTMMIDEIIELKNCYESINEIRLGLSELISLLARLI